MSHKDFGFSLIHKAVWDYEVVLKGQFIFRFSSVGIWRTK